jgi:hypothetical protein
MSLSTALKRARALGVDVTVAGDGSVTFKTSVQNAQNAQTEHDAMSDLDRELEEFEASHEA